MAFPDLVSQGDTYSESREGVYPLATITFGDPKQELRVNGARKNKNGTYSGSTMFVLQKSVVGANGATSIKEMRVPTAPELTTDFTAAELAYAYRVLADFMAAGDNADVFLQGGN